MGCCIEESPNGVLDRDGKPKMIIALGIQTKVKILGRSNIVFIWVSGYLSSIVFILNCY